MTADNAGTWILEHTPDTFQVGDSHRLRLFEEIFEYEADSLQKMMAANFSYGIEKDEQKLKANDHDHTKWSNPLEIMLPNAPSMKFFCVYGHGKETEVGHLTWMMGRMWCLRHHSLLAFVLVRRIEGMITSRFLSLMHRYTRGKYEHDDTLADTESPAYVEDSGCEPAQCETTRVPLDLPLHKPSCIDHEYTDHERNPKVQ